MRLNVPFIKQETDYTCGPTALQMALAYFGRTFPVTTLSAMASTTEKSGTARKGMVRALNILGFQTHAHHDGSLDEVKFFLEQGAPVIVNYRDLKYNEGHYGVIVGIEEGKVILHDPFEETPFIEIDAIQFDARWYGFHSKKYTRWLLAVSDQPLLPYEGHIVSEAS